MKPIKLTAMVLVVAGIVLLVLGIYQFVAFRDSLGGAFDRIGRAVTGSSGYVKPILLIVGGLVAGGAGFFLLKKNR